MTEIKVVRFEDTQVASMTSDTMGGVERYKAESILEEIESMRGRINELIDSLTEEEYYHSSLSGFLNHLECEMTKINSIIQQRD